MLAIPTFFELPCILGGAILVICAIVYLVAALKGEAWQELAPAKARKKTAGTVIAAPTRAPPRLTSVSNTRKDSKADLVTNEASVAYAIQHEDSAVGSGGGAADTIMPAAPNTPVPAPPRKASASGKASAKPTWIGRHDPASGQTYYENMATQETQWELPAGIVTMEDLSI